MAPASDSFDAALSVVGPAGTVVVMRDNRGSGAAETLQLSLPDTGMYVVVARGYAGMAGTYTLTLIVEEQ